MARDQELAQALNRVALAVNRPTALATNSTPDAVIDNFLGQINALCADLEAKFPIPPNPGQGA